MNTWEKILGIAVVVLLLAGGIFLFTGKKAGVGQIRLVVLDPAHFHASLLQEKSLAGVSDTVHVFAPEGDGLNQYLSTVNSFNSRDLNPTGWKEIVYSGPDYLERMTASAAGNVAVIAGDNARKTEYIFEAVKAGYNVLADKPMAINSEDYELLRKAYSLSHEKHLTIYELMTERYDILNIVERELLMDKNLFGTLTKGTPENPSVTMKSVHYFFKTVSGKPLVRPAWYYDVTRQGEGIADVTTHLIDLMQWQCFPGTGLTNNDVKLLSASHFPTELTPEQYSLSTGMSQFPDYLLPTVKDGKLDVMSNGNIKFSLKDVNASVDVRWDFVAPEGAGDTFTSVKRGSGASVVIRQNAATSYKRELYVCNTSGIAPADFESSLRKSVERLHASYPYLSVRDEGDGMYMIDIPDEYRSGHTEHFGKVASAFFSYLNGMKIPAWEEQNALSKYYLTTEAVSTAGLASGN